MNHAGGPENRAEQPAQAVRPSRPGALLPLASGLLCVASSAWLWAAAGWLADLIANLAAQWAALGVVLLALALARRRWAITGLTGAGLVLALIGVAAPPRLKPHAGEPGPTVRVLVLNASTTNDKPADLSDLLAASLADVVVLLEPPPPLLDALRADHPLRAELPHAWIPEQAGPGYTVVLTRWPQAGGEGWGGDESSTHAGGIRAMRINKPDSPFMLLVLHPDSPRTPKRWAEGNRLVRHAAAVINSRMTPTGLPVLAAGDLNSAPTGYRSRLFCKLSGLSRAKPRARASGTWPTPSFWPLRVAIDDVLADPSVRLVSWRTIAVPGSDHSAVEAELALPAP